jgi:hypothetical protein
VGNWVVQRGNQLVKHKTAAIKMRAKVTEINKQGSEALPVQQHSRLNE